MTDLTKLTRDQIGRAEWEEICRRLERLEEAETESDKLLAYARGKLGRRDIHSMYEVVDRLEKCESAITAADAYILALRQAWYGNPDKPSVRENAVARLNTCGQAWTAARATLEGK